MCLNAKSKDSRDKLLSLIRKYKSIYFKDVYHQTVFA